VANFLFDLMLAWILVVLHVAKIVTFNNTQPRTTVAGETIDAHDGTITQFTKGGDFYYYSMGYGGCLENGINCTSCGQTGNNSIGIWSSKDLSQDSWRFIGPARTPAFPTCTYFRSHCIFNTATRKFILWISAHRTKYSSCDVCASAFGTASCYVIATADSPKGPFEYRGVSRPSASVLGHGGKRTVGDFDILVDESDRNRSAYMVLTHYVHGQGHPVHNTTGNDMLIFKLTPDCLNFTIQSTLLTGIPDLIEAPSLFQRRNTT
jgi:hypothetical protein